MHRAGYKYACQNYALSHRLNVSVKCKLKVANHSLETIKMKIFVIADEKSMYPLTHRKFRRQILVKMDYLSLEAR